MTPDERYEVCQLCEWFRDVIKQCKKMRLYYATKDATSICKMPYKEMVKCNIQ